MTFLARFRILTKILAIVLLMAAVAGVISWLGISALNTLNAGADNMNRAAKRALLAARAAQDVIGLNRSEYRIALDPRSENRAEVRRAIDEQMKNLMGRLDDIGQTRDERAKALLPPIKDAWSLYRQGMEATLRLGDGVKDFQMSDQSGRLNESAKKSRDAAEKLQSAVQAISDRLIERIELFAKDAAKEYETTSRLLLMVTGIGTLFGLSAGFLIGQFGIAKPMRSLVGLLQRLAKGEEIEISGTGRADEIGETARAVNGIKVMLADKARQEAETKSGQDRVAADKRRREMIKLADDFEGAVGEIVETVSSASTELEASAGTLTATADRARQVTSMVAAASEEASTNVQSVASATEEMASSVNEISRQVQDSARIASEAVLQAQRTNDRVGELSRAASRIGDVVELINTIAGQTNLLALNATIEAARAGEAGRGFAVVASEVKALAEQTAKATGEISQQINGIQAATNESVMAIREIGDTIGKMSEIASTIAAAVEEQGAATQEISRNVQQAAHGTQEVSSNITDVQRGASETGSASSQVFSAARTLSRDSTRPKQEVGKFLDTVRAA
jgi:methyl-accepting chemotaxis protein